jgi:oligopeptide/dipeptide ABC transporter ATP-binding protein
MMDANVPSPLMAVSDLRKEFHRTGWLPWVRRPTVRAVDGVSLSIRRGETLGLVGESGSGKSTLARCLVGLFQPSAGSLRLNGTELAGPDEAAWRHVRREVQMIFQDPHGALNPRISVRGAISEHLRSLRFGTRAQIRQRVEEMLALVGLSAEIGDRYPHELSGGQLQRVVIARAIGTHPALVIADEPVSALDVSTRAQIVNLLRRLQHELDLAVLFISHDLNVVAYICQRVAVMYLGQIVELAPRDRIFNHPAHPYTRALLSANPIPDPVRERARPRILLEGDPPDPANPPTGCRFHTRCPLVMERCSREIPEFRPAGPDQWAACHLLPVQ